MFVTHFVLAFGYSVLYGNWVPDWCDGCIICITNWFIQISSEFKERLLYEDFISEDTKVLLYLPWPTRKQSLILISSIQNLVFLFCSILSANTDPLVCVGLVFWKELNKFFCTFSARVSPSRCRAICPIPFFDGWNELPSAQNPRVVHWIVTWKVYLDCPCVGIRNRKHPHL